MRTSASTCWIAAICLNLPSTLFAQVRLAPVVSVPNPTFVTHAGDGSNRLFVLEQRGIVDVLRSGASAPTTFLDIRAKVLAGGERGLLGLAFHPLYASNGRLFVYYTRVPDGALVISEYTVSRDPDLADPTEKVLMTIAHPINANHNGGMLAFGPGGYLYIGVGDGGAANDPPNNAQNIETLLGKILRIDVDRSETPGVPYSVPPSNPFVGTPGRDEIFAFGFRNPWRFSFDRTTSQAWIADVGQGAREEVDTPILGGGNYGWRVLEGTACTGNDPSLCRPGNYIAPLFEYSHEAGRCSITGGYVYRGRDRTLPEGIYVYGDYCSGEIFTWDGRAQTTLLRTTLDISSFGEDERGELYVTDLEGSINKIVAVPCVVTVSPAGARLRAAGGSGEITVSTTTGCGWTAVSNAPWITIAAPGAGSGQGSVRYTVARSSGRFRVGTLNIAGQIFSIIQSR
jgi:glucose/sorbosone dehydrogenase